MNIQKAVFIGSAVLLVGVLGLVRLPAYKAKNTHLKVKDLKVNSEVAHNQTEWDNALAGKSDLNKSSTLVLQYDNESSQCVTVKNLHFPIDLIWVNSSKKVITIQQNILVKNYNQLFCPTSLQKYVVALPAGSIEKNQIRPGSDFQI